MQLFMVILAVSTLLFYIQPTITNVRAVQDQMSIYQSELDRVNEVNTLLSKHISDINLLPLSDIKALERYVPTVVDEIAVMRDLQLLAREVNVQLTELEFAGRKVSEATEDVSTKPVMDGSPAKFSMSITSNYAGLKAFLAGIEANDYQIMVDSLKITPTDGQLLANLQLSTYELGLPFSSNEEGAGSSDANQNEQ